MRKPLVSAIIPAYNRERTIARSVGSALAQTYPEIEVIVVDDGSSDRTMQVLQQFSGRISVHRQENAGPGQARNTGAGIAQGEILAFLDSDDEWLPTKIERQVRMMQAHGSAMACCICNARYAQDDGRKDVTSFGLAGLHVPHEHAVWENPDEVLATTFVLFNQVAAIRKDAFEAVGGFNPTLRLMEDYELSLRLATLGEWGIIREPLVVKHEDTRGIGVTAMSDEIKHLNAQEKVFECILAAPFLARSSITGPISAALRRARFQRSIHQWMLGKPRWLASAGRAALALDRLRKAVSRRLTGHPRPRMRPL